MKNKIHNNISKNIKRILKERKIKQRDLAIHLDVVDSFVCDIIYKRKHLSLVQAVKVMKFLEVKFEELIK